MSMRVTHRTTVTHSKTTLLPIPNPPPLHVNPRSAATAVVDAGEEKQLNILWATTTTYKYIMDWPLNSVERWYHPCGRNQYNGYSVGETLNFRVKGDPSNYCKVVVLEKLPLTEYSILKGTKSVGPFTAEAEFPWAMTSDTYLIRVKRI